LNNQIDGYYSRMFPDRDANERTVIIVILDDWIIVIVINRESPEYSLDGDWVNRRAAD